MKSNILISIAASPPVMNNDSSQCFHILCSFILWTCNIQIYSVFCDTVGGVEGKCECLQRVFVIKPFRGGALDHMTTEVFGICVQPLK